MKKLAYILTAVLALAACAKEEIHHPTEAEAPATASVYEPIITVDQETNQVTFSIDAKGVIPVWLFYNSKTEDFSDRYTRNNLTRIFTAAGDYKVWMHVMNAAGVTPDYVEKSFHINNTLVDFSKYVNVLAGGKEEGATRTWHIDGTVEKHLGCGPAGTEGLEWYSAAPGDKDAFGLYEDKVSFGSDYSYVYDPGDDGATYVNIGVTVSPFVDQKGDAAADYNATVNAQTSTYSFAVEGDDLYLVLPEHTLFPYIDNDAFWAAPRFKVLEAKPASLVLVHDNGEIAWHFILTSKEGPVKFTGFNYNADSNLWKPADEDHTLSFWYAPGWSQIDDPETVQNGAEYTLTLPEATTDQWQAQFFINPTAPVVLSADKNYDFSVIVTTNNELPGLTLKLTDVGDDGNFLFTEREKFPAGETVYYLTDLKGIDAPNGVKMVFDFGGNAADTEVSIARITLKDHAIDDGTVLPSEEPDVPVEEGAHYDITGSTNFWRSMTYTMGFYTAHGSGWEGLPDTGFQADDQNFVYNLSMPEATDSQWQRQVAFHTNMSSSAEKKYDFCCTLTSTMDIPGVTIKLVKEGDDNTFYFADRHDIKAAEPFVYKMPDMDGIDMEAIALFFDFGGNPEGAEVEIKDICFQEHQEPQGGQGGVVFDYNSASNLWKAVDAEGGHTYSQYTATGEGWSGLPNPDITQDGSSYSFTYESATSAQWQAQFFVIPTEATAFALSAEKTYDFQVKVLLSQDVPGVTFKLTDTASDDNFLFTERCDIEAYEEFTFELIGLAGINAAAVKMVFDFGGCPDDTEVIIKDIILQEHTGGSAPAGNGFDYNADENLWKAADAAHTYSQYTATGDGWSGLPNPDITQDGSSYSFTYESATSAQWQAQFFIIPDAAIALSAGKTYDFQCKVLLSQDVPGVTFKLTDTASDNNFLFTERRDIEAYEEFTFELTGLAGIDAAAVKMVFDFGGCPDDTEVIIKDIILREHK